MYDEMGDLGPEERRRDRELDDLKAAIASAKNHKELGAAVVKWIEATEPATVEDSK